MPNLIRHISTPFIFYIFLVSGITHAETRIYTQIRSVSLEQSGKVIQSQHKTQLYEHAYEINLSKKIIHRIRTRRLDRPAPSKDHSEYQIHFYSEERGQEIITAVKEDGSEILTLGPDFAFTQRILPAAKAISGVYKRK